jgi:tripartite-type tricarboxylate transporter receptor subunit TctC
VFARLAQTATWKKYLEENQFEEGFQRSAEFSRFLDEYAERIRGILREAGVKVVR